MMAREYGPAQIVEPDSTVIVPTVCRQCGREEDLLVHEHYEGDSVEWSWTCPTAECGYENLEAQNAADIGWEG